MGGGEPHPERWIGGAPHPERRVGQVPYHEVWEGVPQHEVEGGYHIMKRGMKINLLIHREYREAIVSQFIM